MLDNLKKYKVILASNSPRRKELLSGLGVDYEIRTLPDVDESYPDTLRGADIPLYIAKEKANAYRNMLQSGELMITADTIVWLDGKVLGKPKDRKMLYVCCVPCPVALMKCLPVFVLLRQNGSGVFQPGRKCVSLS